MKLNIPKEWFEANIDKEEGHEIGAGRPDALLDLDVRPIGGRYSAQLKEDGRVIDHMVCESKRDVGWICREMLRWFVKTGGKSKWASAARRRQISGPIGKIWRRHRVDKALNKNT
jgi:hypothetical protein